MRLLIPILASAVVACPAFAQGSAGTPIQAGQQYQGGTRVAAPAVGVSFLIPEGHAAEFDGETEAFLMVASAHPGTRLGAFALSQGTPEVVGELVIGSLTEMGLQLQLRGQPERTGDILRASFVARTEGGQGLLLAAVRGGPPGNALAVVALGPAEDETRAQGVLDQIIESAQFTTPGAEQWRAALGGVRLSYLGQASTWSPGGAGDGSHASETTERYDFCSNGQYGYYMHSESYISVEGAGSMSSEKSDEHQGQWSLLADIVGGAWLILEVSDGRVFEYRVEERQDGVVLGEDIYEAARSPLCQ